MVSGIGYVLSQDCVQMVAAKSVDPSYKVIHLEDVNTAGIVNPIIHPVYSPLLL